MSGAPQQNADAPRAARILLIEDSPVNSYLVSRLLGKHGYEVVVRDDGGAGLEEALRQPPDLVLLDLLLPTMDGWDIARSLKADPRTRDVPIIALTTQAMDGDREKAIEAGCNAYVTKPVHVPDLLELVQRMTASRDQTVTQIRHT